MLPPALSHLWGQSVGTGPKPARAAPASIPWVCSYGLTSISVTRPTPPDGPSARFHRDAIPIYCTSWPMLAQDMGVSLCTVRVKRRTYELAPYSLVVFVA